MTPAAALAEKLRRTGAPASGGRVRESNETQVARDTRGDYGAAKEAAVKAKAACHANEQERLLRRLSGMECSSNEDDNNVSTTSVSDDDAPPHVDAYTEERHNGVVDRMGKGAARKCYSSLLPRFVHILIMLK
ncbi:hypothetical protein D1007_48967 [Hordeum vulgare]|nr:hypothetical protein D1007_48967 [Hordeum vulgare]